MTVKSLREAAVQWMADDPEEQHVATTRAHLEDEAWLRRHFSKPLDFGTAGIRGPLGPGPAGMNRALVRRVAAGVASMLREHRGSALVVIGFDARDGSQQFAEDAARVLCGAGHRVHIFENVVPTPRLAHAVVWHHADAGLMVTASHNPPRDNGIKVYDHLGAQIVAPVDANIRDRIDWEAPLSAIPMPNWDELIQAGMLCVPDAEDREAWLSAALAQRVATDAQRAPVRIGYSAMHGVSGEDTLTILKRGGQGDLHVVAEQHTPDGSFPTLPNPNPQDPSALQALLALGATADCDLLLANDPDGDRLAVAIRCPDGRERIFTGDEIGVLLADDLLTHGDRTQPRSVIASLVSTGLVADIAATHGARHVETLTGFKWISRAALESEHRGERFVMGFEEAIGFCAGLHVRDKDGVTAALLVADLASRLAANGETLEDALYALHARHQVVVNAQRAIRFEGTSAAEDMGRVMRALRADTPSRIGEHAIVATRDLLTRRIHCLLTDETHETTLPAADVLEWTLANGDRVLLRPSGTEPKLKIYVERRREWRAGVSGQQQHRDAMDEAERLLALAGQHLKQVL